MKAVIVDADRRSAEMIESILRGRDCTERKRRV